MSYKGKFSCTLHPNYNINSSAKKAIRAKHPIILPWNFSDGEISDGSFILWIKFDQIFNLHPNGDVW